MSRFLTYVSKFPALLGAARRTKRRVNFALYGSGRFKSDLMTGAILTAVAPVAGDPNATGSFFGYYDKSPWSRSGKKLLSHVWRGGSVLHLVLSEDGHYREFGVTEAWNFQQGAMLQWLQSSDTEVVVHNTVRKGMHAAVLRSSAGEHLNTYDLPIQALSSNSQHFASLNYERLQKSRPDYGYKIGQSRTGLSDWKSDGLWFVHWQSGESTLRVPLSRLSESWREAANLDQWVNHVLFSPDGERVVFLHRAQSGRHFISRLFAYNYATDELTLIPTDGLVSHYCWLGADTLLVYTGALTAARYQLVDLQDGAVSPTREPASHFQGLPDGHPSISPDGKWIVTDTYPDKAATQDLILIEAATGTRRVIGRFHAPLQYRDGIRCDLHPRWSHDSKSISIDSAHTGQRLHYALALDAIVGATG